jgi:predicted transcriptional regulator
LERAQCLLSASRRKRSLFADCRIDIGDPVWDILLGLLVSGARTRQVLLEELIDHVGLPEIVTRRYAAQLCEAGLAIQDQGHAGQAAPRFRLTRKGEGRVTAFLEHKADNRRPNRA